MSRGNHPNSLKNLKPIVRGEVRNPRGRETLGALLKEWLNLFAEQELTEAQLRGIAEDDTEPAPKRTAAVRMLRLIENGNIADFEPWLRGEKTMDDLKSEGIDTSIVKKAKIRRIPTKNGDIEEREIELHDRSGSDFDRLVNHTDGTPKQSVAMEGKVGVEHAHPAEALAFLIRRMNEHGANLELPEKN